MHKKQNNEHHHASFKHPNSYLLHPLILTSLHFDAADLVPAVVIVDTF